MGYQPNINCSELLQAALLENQALKMENAMLQQELTSLYDTADSQNNIIHQLTAQALEKDSLIADQRTTIALQQQNIDGLSQQSALMQQVIDGLKTTTENDRKLIAKQENEIQKIRHKRDLLAKDKYGHKSEKLRNATFSTNVKGIGLDPQEEAEVNAFFAEHGYVKIEKQPTPDLLEQGLPVKTVVIEGPKGSIYLGEITTHKLIHHKAWNQLLRIVRHVYLEKGAEPGTFRNITPPVPGPKTKCLADASMTAQLLLDKFLYHMPLQRQQAKHKRSGADIPYSTLCDWISYGCRTLKPLWELLMMETVKSKLLHCDETTLKVIDKAKEGKNKLHRGYMWVMFNHLQGLVAFKYAKGRGHEDIDDILSDFTGYLSTDGYGAYDKYGRQKNVIHLKCLSHCRRYFKDSVKTDPKRATYVLEKYFAPLYLIEQRCRDENMDWDQIAETRQKYAVPILNAFHKWLLENQSKVKPETPIAIAINYIIKRWKEVTEYCSEGFLAIDNNGVERMIRDLALSRKNWLFAGSHESAANIAVMFSLFGTCKLQGIDPEEWLIDVLNRIDTCPQDKLFELLPKQWKKNRQKKAAA